VFEIERRFGGTYDTYPVYTADEADRRGLDYHDDWTQVDEGEWGRTDDGYVQQCHKIYEMDRSEGYALQLVYTAGRPIVSFRVEDDHSIVEKAPSFEFLPYLRTGGYQYAKAKTWQEAEAEKRRTARAVQAWASFFILRSGCLTDEDWVAIGRVYRTDDAIQDPGATARRLFKIDEVQRKAMQRLAELVVDAGEDPEDVVEKYDRLFDEAVDGDAEDKRVALDVADRLRDMLQMNPDRRPQPNQGDGDGLDALIDRTETAEQEVGRIEEADAEVLPSSTDE